MATTYDLNFDGSTIYGELTHPVTFTGDFEIHVVFQLAPGASGNLAFVGDADADQDWFRIDATNGGLDFKYNSSYVSTDGSFTPDTNTHTAKYKYVGTNLSAYYDDVYIGYGVISTATINLGLVGKRSGTSNYFDGQIKSIKFIDKSGASDVIQTYQINSGPPVYEMGAELWPGGQVPALTPVTSHLTGEDLTKGVAYIVTGMPETVRMNDGGAWDIENGELFVFIGNYSGGIRFRNISATETSPAFTPSVKPYISTISDGTLYQPIAGGSLGSELVTNGGFDTDSDWNKGTGWTISGGVGVSDGANGNQPLHQTITLIDGEPYLLGTTMNLTNGRVVIEEIGAATQTHHYTTSGVQSHTFIADQVSTIIVHRSYSGNPYDGTVDNTTVKALPESIILYNVEAGDWEATVTTYPGGAARRRRARRKAQVQMMYTLNQSPILNEYYEDAVGDLR